MAFLYLSPSGQTFNPYITGGNEGDTMNRLADLMVPYLHASGITVTRNGRNQGASASISESNAGIYDLHLALHSNAAPPVLAGTLRGIDLYYSPLSPRGRQAAEDISSALKAIYPLPEQVQTLSSTLIGEVYKVKHPAVLAEFGYHDNREDALWITGHLPEIAAAASAGTAKFFSLPVLTPKTPRKGVVNVAWGSVNLREMPRNNSKILSQAYDGAEITVWNRYEDWFVASFGNVFGFCRSQYIDTDF